MASEQESLSEITQCLNLLRPETSDDAKFVALMLLPRLLQQDQENVIRNSSDSELPDNILKTIAIHIISCFCEVEELLSKRQVHARIPTLSTLLVPKENEELAKEILKMFIRLSSDNQAVNYLVDNKVVTKILSCITTTTNDEVRDLALQVVSNITNTLIISTDQLTSDIASIQNYMYTVLNYLSLTFRTNQEKFKFELLNFFVDMFSYMTDQFVQIVFITDKTKLDEWIQNIKFGLKEILSSRLGNEQRDKALSLIMLLLHHIGAPWLFASTTENLSLNQTSANKIEDFKFAALVIQLACVEVRLLLDDLAEKYEKQELQEFQSNKRHETILSACYTILEKSIEYLSQIDIELAELNLDPELLLRLKGTMTETFRFIIEHLVDIKETTFVEEVIKDTCVLASIRVLSAWLAEDSSLEKVISNAMPFLIEICQYRHVDLIKIMTPAFLNLTSLDQPREAFLKHGGTQMVIDYLVKFGSNKKDYNDISGPIQELLSNVEDYELGSSEEKRADVHSLFS
ncbi:10162_t:CDS:2 [Funneliformis caledonium]|uniref:10162_t:CDS:1 n=1 Tax=Funneliformis caledonium TaxID=1117310 RepID=A0A9N9HLA7_9GLOM|nr:10162_t:CDS:2 [Funneliformis caledonium]